MEPTLSFSIINILGTENNNGELRKGPTLSSAMKEANASSPPPSDCPPYEHQLHPHDTLEGISCVCITTYRNDSVDVMLWHKQCICIANAMANTH